jgi:ABC-type transport system substrate-binding protein
MRHTRSAFTALACLALPTLAAAQAPPAATPPATPPAASGAASTDPRCAPTTARPADGTIAPAPQGGTAGSAQQPLGERLARSDGVLCPPANVDPEIRAPTPDVGTTPVIPPPGSPGGNPNVRPK